jgi:pimeloyl-ACP methyl ester carboxylesterase
VAGHHGGRALSRAAIGRALTLDTDDVRVNATRWTPSTDASPNGTRVLLVHGLGANTLSWEPIGQLLADDLCATVTAIDLIGFGRTRLPGRPATIATNRRLVTGVLEELGPSMIVGNSMGAAIGIGVTARRPDLVTQLVMVNPALPHARPGMRDVLRLARFAPVMVGPVGRHVVGTRARLLGPERLVDSSLEWSLHDPSRLDPDLRLRLVALAAERYAYPEAPAAYAEAARSMLLYLARGLHDDLAAAAPQRPTLLLHGEHDRLVNVAAAREVAARHDHVDLHVLEGVGHAPQLEDPEGLVGVVSSWLDGRMSGCQIRDRASASSTSPSGGSSTP